MDVLVMSRQRLRHIRSLKLTEANNSCSELTLLTLNSISGLQQTVNFQALARCRFRLIAHNKIFNFNVSFLCVQKRCYLVCGVIFMSLI